MAEDTDLGGVDAVRFAETVRVHRRVSTAGDLVRIRDRDANGRLVADHGYSPERARYFARLLIQGAQRLDPDGHLKLVTLDDLPRAAVPPVRLAAAAVNEDEA